MNSSAERRKTVCTLLNQQRQVMALARGLTDLRAVVLGRLRVPVQNSLQDTGAPVALSLLRGFAEGTFLNKDVVTERILNVVKNFDKVDQAKVCDVGHARKAFDKLSPRPFHLSAALWLRLIGGTALPSLVQADMPSEFVVCVFSLHLSVVSETLRQRIFSRRIQPYIDI